MPKACRRNRRRPLVCGSACLVTGSGQQVRDRCRLSRRLSAARAGEYKPSPCSRSATRLFLAGWRRMAAAAGHPGSLCKEAAGDRVDGPSGPRMARSASAMRRGLSIRSIATILAPVIVNATSVIGLLSAAVTAPADPLISAGKVSWASRVKVSARPATAAAPRIASAALERTTTSGSRASSSASKSPSRAAVRKASAIARCRVRSVPRSGATPWTRRRARLASWRAAAAGERPTMAAMSPNGTANMSCKTNASRSAGASVCRITSSAGPMESPSSASVSGSMPSASLAVGSGRCHPHWLVPARLLA